MIKFKSLVVTTALLLASAASQASVITYSVSAYTNTTSGGVGAAALGGAFTVTAGETLQFHTDPNQMWSGAVPGDGNYAVLHTNANGVLPGNGWAYWNFDGVVSSVGALIGDIGGDRRFIGAGDKTLAAWGSGELRMWYLDTNKADNSGVITSTVTTAAAVPEPASVALFGLALAGLALARRRKG